MLRCVIAKSSFCDTPATLDVTGAPFAGFWVTALFVSVAFIVLLGRFNVAKVIFGASLGDEGGLGLLVETARIGDDFRGTCEDTSLLSSLESLIINGAVGDTAFPACVALDS